MNSNSENPAMTKEAYQIAGSFANALEALIVDSFLHPDVPRRIMQKYTQMLISLVEKKSGSLPSGHHLVNVCVGINSDGGMGYSFTVRDSFGRLKEEGTYLQDLYDFLLFPDIDSPRNGYGVKWAIFRKGFENGDHLYQRLYDTV